MNIRQCPISAVADATMLVAVVAILCLLTTGCGGDDDLGGRVAIDVIVQVGGETPESGTLVLKPGRGVRSPLIRIPISDGTGSLRAAKGPVPGSYNASFRSGVAGGSIDEQLSKTGREMPSFRAGASAENSQQRNRQAPKAKSEVSVSVPDENPATLTVSFDAA